MQFEIKSAEKLDVNEQMVKDEVSIKDKSGAMSLMSESLNVLVSVYPAGEFEVKDKNGNPTGEKKPYEEGIKCKFGKMDYAIKITPAQSLFLTKALSHPEIHAEIMKRFRLEMTEINSLI